MTAHKVLLRFEARRRQLSPRPPGPPPVPVVFGIREASPGGDGRHPGGDRPGRASHGRTDPEPGARLMVLFPCDRSDLPQVPNRDPSHALRLAARITPRQ